MQIIEQIKKVPVNNNQTRTKVSGGDGSQMGGDVQRGDGSLGGDGKQSGNDDAASSNYSSPYGHSFKTNSSLSEYGYVLQLLH